MNPHELAITVLLGVGVITTAICVLGMLLMPEFLEKLHYMATVSSIAATAILAAVCLKEGWGQPVVKTALVCGVGLLMNAVLTHATARAARVRNLGRWTAQPEENISGTRGQGQHEREQERRSNE